MSETITTTDRPWLKHYDPGVPQSIQYETICLPEKLESIAHAYPSKTALIFMGYKMSYRELVTMRDRFATCLADFGIQKGDRVAILSENRPEWAFTDYACLLNRCADVPIYPTLPSGQISYILRDSGATAIFVSSRAQLDKILALKKRQARP